MRIFLILAALACGLSYTAFVFAEDAPVVAATASDAGASPDENQNDSSQASNVNQGQAVEPAENTPAPTSNLTLEQRVGVLERQLSASNQVGLMNQVNDLQNQLQELQGQVEQLSHAVQTLQSQSSSQYSDLDQRLSKLGSNTSQNAAVSVSTTSPKANKANDNAAESQAYDAAYGKVKNGNYSEAIVSLKKFLEQYPNGAYAGNAHYWLGQMLLLKGNGREAEKEFQTVISHYADNPKVKDAQLKLGFAYLLQNKNAQAKLQFKKVMEKYPESSTAKLAKARLAEMA